MVSVFSNPWIDSRTARYLNKNFQTGSLIIAVTTFLVKILAFFLLLLIRTTTTVLPRMNSLLQFRPHRTKTTQKKMRWNERKNLKKMSCHLKNVKPYFSSNNRKLPHRINPEVVRSRTPNEQELIINLL